MNTCLKNLSRMKKLLFACSVFFLGNSFAQTTVIMDAATNNLVTNYYVTSWQGSIHVKGKQNNLDIYQPEERRVDDSSHDHERDAGFDAGAD